jgi:outer membrane protein assembly factor BamD
MRNLALILLALTLFGCSSRTKELTTDVGTMAEGDYLKDDEFYEEARTQYQRIRTEFPSSPLQVEADLKIAETYFLDEAYPAAATAYEDFIRTYPGRPEIPKALYYLGLSHSRQMPSNPQRDTRPSSRVIDVFTRLIVDYPNSEYTGQAMKEIDRARGQLAEKIYEIALFYERTKEHEAAARRFGQLASQFPESSYTEEALARQVRSLRRATKTDEANTLARQFQEKFPQSEFMSMIKP